MDYAGEQASRVAHSQPAVIPTHMLAAVQAKRPVGQLGQWLPERRSVAVPALRLTAGLLPLLSLKNSTKAKPVSSWRDRCHGQ